MISGEEVFGKVVSVNPETITITGVIHFIMVPKGNNKVEANAAKFSQFQDIRAEINVMKTAIVTQYKPLSEYNNNYELLIKQMTSQDIKKSTGLIV